MSSEMYGLDRWGQGFFAVDQSGHLLFRPAPGQDQAIDVFDVTERAVATGLKSPLLLRFPQALHFKVAELSQAFAQAITEFAYPKHYQGVFPMKVNPRHEVVDPLLRAGKDVRLGIEVGSKSELWIALGSQLAPDALLICNGFKDETFFEMAFAAHQMGRRVVLVIEQLQEIHDYIRIAKAMNCQPLLGLRCRLNSRGSGKWEDSGGESSKFGLSTLELLECIRVVRAEKAENSLAMLHFHIGSQITQIRRIKTAVREASRVYAKVRKMGVPIQYLNVGGGLGVDYDGSSSSSDHSVNYSLQEFANDVVYTVGSICEHENVPHPILVSESGRALTAYHSMLILSVENRPDARLDVANRNRSKTRPAGIVELEDILLEITVKNFKEYYHDALEQRDELFSLFDLGYLGIEERAEGEKLFREICEKALRFAKTTDSRSHDFALLAESLRKKYVANFSVFQSVPDSWAIGQLFPVVPIHRLDEAPTEFGILADLTCDSDGKIDAFVDPARQKGALELHPFRENEPYYLAVCLVGAYQEVMGSHHNMFGRVNEAQIWLEDDGRVTILQPRSGDQIGDVAQIMGYETDRTKSRIEEQIHAATALGQLDSSRGEEILRRYAEWAKSSTYSE